MNHDRRKELLISDLSVCRPQSALADRYAPRKWKLLPYEHANFRGVMLGAIGSRHARLLRLPLRLKGWYDVYVGLYRTYEEIGVRLKLSSDRAFRKFRIPIKQNFKNWLAVVEEHFWRAADLTGESILIAPLQVVQEDIDNYVAYFRLVPLSPAKVRRLRADRRRRDTKRLIAMNDGTDIIARYSIGSTKELAEEIDVYRDTDFAGVCWELIKGSRPKFPVPGVEEHAFPDGAMIPLKIYEEYRRVWKVLKKKGFNYLRTLRELTRSAGLELHVSHRMCEAAQPPYEDFHHTDFLDGNYEWCCRHADGAPVPRFSYAKPAVQNHMIRIFAEAARYGVDGFHLLTIRGGPMVLYEEEMTERFTELHGKKVDPRTLPLSDKRIFSVRAQLFGEYLKRLRTAVRSAARKAGHKPPILSVHGLSNFKACRHFGIDFASWAREGLIDRIVACPWGEEWGGKSNFHWPDFDVTFYRDCVAGTKTELFAQVPPPSRKLPRTPETYCDYYRRRAEKFYRGGVQGLYFWDTPWRHCHADHLDVLSVLGHRRDLSKQTEVARKRTREIQLRSLLGLELAKDRFPAWLGG